MNRSHLRPNLALLLTAIVSTVHSLHRHSASLKIQHAPYPAALLMWREIRLPGYSMAIQSC